MQKSSSYFSIGKGYISLPFRDEHRRNPNNILNLSSYWNAELVPYFIYHSFLKRRIRICDLQLSCLVQNLSESIVMDHLLSISSSIATVYSV